MKKSRATFKQMLSRLAWARKLRARGATFAEIGRRVVPPVTPEAIAYLFKKFSARRTLVRKCALVECEIVFETPFKHRRYCSRKHAKRGGERERLGLVPVRVPCRLAECELVLLSVAGHKRFCGKTHSARHYTRENIGFYDRLLNRVKCAVRGCGFWGAGLDKHHIKPRCKGGTDAAENLVWICSNHHKLIHAGLATYDGRKYVDLRAAIRRAEMLKRRREANWLEAK